MFAKLSILAVALPLVSAFTLNTPTDVTNAGQVTITWTATTTDPSSFSLELVNTVFHNSYAIGNNIPTANGAVTINIPEVPPGSGYSIEAVAVDDINSIYSQSGEFSIAPATTTSTSAASTTSSTSSVSSSTSSTSSVSTTSTFTTPSSSATTATSSSPAPSPSSFNSGAASFKTFGAGPAAAMVLAVAAGAVMVF